MPSSKYYQEHKTGILAKNKIDHQLHKDEDNAYSREYRKLHKDELNRKHKIYYENNKDRLNNNRKVKSMLNHEEAIYERKKYRNEHKEHINEQQRVNYAKNRDKRLEQHKLYYENNKDNILAHQKEYNNENKESIALNKHEYQQSHKDELRKFTDNRRLRVKMEVMAHYGNGKCACLKCGNTDIRVLTIDHINGNGAEERRKNGFNKDSRRLYAWLKRNNYPSGFQCLCMNCNWVKRYENNELKGKQKKKGESV